MTAVGAFWLDGKYYFSAGPRTRKARNVERNPKCSLGVAVHGYDVALEGHAHRVTDDAMLQKLAGVFAEGGWAPTVADGGFTHEFSAPSAGPPPWYVYEMTLENVYAVATKEPGGTRRVGRSDTIDSFRTDLDLNLQRDLVRTDIERRSAPPALGQM